MRSLRDSTDAEVASRLTRRAKRRAARPSSLEGTGEAIASFFPQTAYLEHRVLRVASPASLRENLDVPYQAQKTGQVRPGLKIHELKTDNRAVCGNSRRQPMKDLGPGTVTCESCARGHTSFRPLSGY